MPKKSRQKFKYIKNKKKFQDETKVFFIIFKGLSLKQLKQNCLEGESPTLKFNLNLDATLRKNEVFISFKDDLAVTLEYYQEHSLQSNATHLNGHICILYPTKFLKISSISPAFSLIIVRVNQFHFGFVP